MTAGFAFIDTETTGTHADARVIELAVVTYSSGGRRTGSISHLIRGDGTVGGWAAQRVHKIREEDLVGKPSFRTIWPELAERIAGHYVFAHNSGFDLRRINYELSLIRRAPLPSMGCTMALAYELGYARKKTATKPTVSAKLTDLVDRLDLPVNPDHRALNDTEAVAALFWFFRKRHRDQVDAYLSTLAPVGTPRTRTGTATERMSERTRRPTSRGTGSLAGAAPVKPPQNVRIAVERTRAALTDTLAAVRTSESSTLAEFKRTSDRTRRAHVAAQDRLQRAREAQRRTHGDERDDEKIIRDLKAADARRRQAVADLAGLRRLFMGADRCQQATQRRADAEARIAGAELRLSKAREQRRTARAQADRALVSRRKELDAARRELDRALEREAAIRARINTVTDRGFSRPGPSDDLREWVAKTRSDVTRLLAAAKSKQPTEADRRRLDRMIKPST